VQRHYSDSGNQRNGQLIDQYRCEVQLMNERHGAQLGKLASKQEAELQVGPVDVSQNKRITRGYPHFALH
jgi:hypothetical protein